MVSTPNAEYNARYRGLAPGAMRHPDHRFEWTRAEFRDWAAGVAGRRGYQVRYLPGRGRRSRGRARRPSWRCSGVSEITVPELSLVVLVGTSGSGKSTFAGRHFGRSRCISSDHCRGLVSDDENDQAATPDAFDLLHHIAGMRLAAGR